MDKVIRVLGLLLFSSYCLASSSWMSSIPDGTYLSQLSIPGTHKSAASYSPFPGFSNAFYLSTTATQALSIADQLNAGVRFLDISLSDANSLAGYSFEVRQGPAELGDFSSVVISQITSFFSSNPSETIFMSIRSEDCDDEYPCYNMDINSLDMAKLQAEFISTSIFYQNIVTSATTLGEVRGKIIFINSLANSLAYTDFGLDSTCQTVNVQDQIQLVKTCEDTFNLNFAACVDAAAKRDTAVSFLQSATTGYDLKYFWINIAASNYEGLFSSDTAAVVNPAIKSYYDGLNPSTDETGAIVIMDFPEATAPGIIQSIYCHSIAVFANGPPPNFAGTYTGAYGGDAGQGYDATTYPGNRRYSFSVTGVCEPSTIIVDLMSTVDTYLYIITADSEDLVYSDDDDGEGLNSRIEEDIAPGNYILVAATWSSKNVFDDYTITINYPLTPLF